MATTIRILHLDDNPLDAELVAMTLEIEYDRLPTTVKYVPTKAEYLSALEQKDFDIILSDYRMPDYDGDQALAAAQLLCPGVPFIMVTGELGEELVIETLKRGATDYVLKDRIFRLVPAIQRALTEAENNRKRREAEELLRKSEERYRAAMDSHHFLLAQTDAEGRYTWLHDPHLGSNVPAVLGKLDSELSDSAQARQLEEIKRRVISTGTSFRGEVEIPRSDGTHCYDVIIEPRRDETGRIVGLTAAGLDITDRKRTEEALKDSRRTLALAVKATNLGLFDYYPQSGVMLWNDLSKEHFGLPPESHVDYQLFLQAIHPEDRERVRTGLQEALRPGSSGNYYAEYRVIGIQDGKERWIVARGQVFFDDSGKAVRLIGARTDVTVQKRMEESLRAHEATMDAFFEASPAILNILDEEMRFVQTDRLTPAYFGLDRQSLIGRSVKEFLPEFADEFLAPIVQRVIRTGKPELNVEVPGPVPHRNGEKGIWQTAYFPVPLPDRRIGLGAMGIDITDLKAAQREIQRLQDEYHLLLEQQSDMIAKVTRQGKILYVNERCVEMIGVARARMMQTGYLPAIHAEDLSNVMQQWERTFEPPECQSAFEARIMTAHGWRWLSLRNKAIMDQDGQPTMAISVARDVTEQKEAEVELRRREVRFRSLISSSNEAIALVDEHGIVLAVSQSASSILGHSVEELVGKDVHYLIQGAQVDAIAKSLLRLNINPDTPQFVLLRLQSERMANPWIELEATAILSGSKLHAYFFKLRPVLLEGS